MIVVVSPKISSFGYGMITPLQENETEEPAKTAYISPPSLASISKSYKSLATLNPVTTAPENPNLLSGLK